MRWKRKSGKTGGDSGEDLGRQRMGAQYDNIIRVGRDSHRFIPADSLKKPASSFTMALSLGASECISLAG